MSGFIPHEDPSAPLPSPTVHHSSFSFPSIQSRSTDSQASSTSSIQSQQQSTQQPVQNYQSSTPYLKDFNLVATAAKKAQMAVLMRDLDEVAIS